MNKYHLIDHVMIKDGVISLVVDGKVVKKNLEELSPLLAQASEQEQQAFTISPSGYGIHWPYLDEDIAVDHLLGITHRRPKQKVSA